MKSLRPSILSPSRLTSAFSAGIAMSDILVPMGHERLLGMLIPFEIKSSERYLFFSLFKSALDVVTKRLQPTFARTSNRP